MIPKIIHYCWINKDKKEDFSIIVKECIKTWKDILPNYEIKEWNIDNFDININKYVREAYDAGKYAFVSDYIRLYVLYRYGGIYMDTDVKVVRSFDSLLNNKVFMGFESLDTIATCLIGAEKNNILIKEMLRLYDNKNFKKENGEYDCIPNTVLLTSLLKSYGIIINNMLQKNDYITVYPKDYFCPLERLTGEVNITDNTFAVHLFNGSWLSKEEKERINLYKNYYTKFNFILPKKMADGLAKLIATYKVEGYKGIAKRFNKKINKNR
ncbi:glycosyltransferase family 32 protein [Megamonas hypermegale]|uniref:glycosyltransferase family 32 protein n=1 Tax=Megamonas hypermegale TaxID=158847 RepID=UPI0026E94428|nr:glycosyltransferase [Megamonas hypermegale]